MNLLPTYEQTIANMQGEMEIPDMADAIWGRVEAALDVEMPVNDSPAPPQGNPFFKQPAVWIIGAGILAIIIVLFLLMSNSKTTPAPQRNLPRPVKPTIKPDTILKQEYKPPAVPQQLKIHWHIVPLFTNNRIRYCKHHRPHRKLQYHRQSS
jgi:hypothetical protein